jgi:PAS domain S-box-containing protein
MDINLWNKLTLRIRAIIGIAGFMILALIAMGLTNYLWESNLAFQEILAMLVIAILAIVIILWIKQAETTERFETELARRMQELGSISEQMKILSSAVEQSVESVVITDKDGKINYVNPAFEIISGYSKADAIGKTPRVLKSGRQSREFYKELWSTITDGGIWHGEFINKRKDGTFYNEEATISPIRNGMGVITHFVAIKNDVTIQKMAQETLMAKNEEISRQNELLEQANRTKSEFLSNMSHELRTPLNAIIGFSELLKDGALGGLAEDQKSYMKDIFDSGQHLLSLINEILDLAKIEEGKMTLDLEPVDIRLALENCLSVVKGKATERSIGLELTSAADIGNVIVDDRKFRQIVLNLLSNAVKFTPDGGKVSMEARLRNRDLLEISVTDTGIGMTGEEMKKLFKPFEQLDGSISRKYGGTGLGLAIVKKITELHGGTVMVTSEPDKGSVFTVLLPCQRSVHEVQP